jgi:hypothetical protein
MSKPYDNYIAESLAELTPSLSVEIAPRVGITRYTESYYNLSRRQLSGMLADAWVEGLKYSFVMIESRKRKRDTQEA